jgi:hypothetical protein
MQPPVLAWLEQHPGEGWQERWLAAGADRGTGWLDDLVAGDPRTPGTKRAAMTYAVAFLMLARVILPGYEFLSAYRSRELFRWVREQHRPDLFARLEQAGAELSMQAPHVHYAVKAITRIVLHTGRDVDQLTGEDVHEHREWFYQGWKDAVRPDSARPANGCLNEGRRSRAPRLQIALRVPVKDLLSLMKGSARERRDIGVAARTGTGY